MRLKIELLIQFLKTNSFNYSVEKGIMIEMGNLYLYECINVSPINLWPWQNKINLNQHQMKHKFNQETK